MYWVATRWPGADQLRTSIIKSKLCFVPASSKTTGKNLFDPSKRAKSMQTSGTVSYAPPKIIQMLIRDQHRQVVQTYRCVRSRLGLRRSL